MKRKTLYTFISIIIWLVLWQIISAIISSPVFLPSPLQTVNALFSLLKTSAYYKSLSYSLLNISIGFFTGLFAGVVLAVAASVNTFLQSVIDVPVKSSVQFLWHLLLYLPYCGLIPHIFQRLSQR